MSVQKNDCLKPTPLSLYQQMFYSAGDAIDILDLQGNILDVNPAFEKLYGWTRDELIGHSLPVIPPNQSSGLAERINKVKNGCVICKFEVECLHKAGHRLTVNLTFSPIYNDLGEVVAISGITRDITEQKVTERLLRESEERYQKLVDMSPEPVAVIRDGRVRYINKAGLKVFGYTSQEDMLNQSIFTLLPSNNRNDVVRKMLSLLKEKEYTVDFVDQEMTRPDGKSIIVEATAMGIVFENKPSIQVLFQDVTERREMEKALLISEEKYRLIAENMNDVVSILDENGIMKYASPSHEIVLGFTSEEYEGQLTFDMIHEEDLPSVLAVFQEILVTGRSQTIELRHKHVTKGWLWLELKGSLFFDERKRTKFILVVGRDIEERKHFQDKLKALAFEDDLTKLPNRRLFEEKVKIALEKAEDNDDKNFAILYLDMDDFKRINDELGHAMGDIVLQQFAERVKSSLREQDILARLGGDEFAILLPNIRSRDSIEPLVARVQKAISKAWISDNNQIRTSSSIGVAYYPEDGRTYSDLLQHADHEMYKQKQYT
ncbi:PAS domain S-box protein [Paenisporosarcina sp. NPDC076898]|uniref:PAS domain S-box protein n=1 Tax=unclassified Paenisporosarcina TaxID=2642018 RepID=UPI003D018C2F